MQTLYVLETGSYLRKEGETLVICKGKQRVETIPAAGLKQLTLAGRASISGAVLDFLINHGIDTVFMTMDGRFRARLLLDDSSHTALRQRQYVRLNDPAYKQGLAAVIVREKLENQSRLLLRRASQYDRPELRTVGAQIKALRRKSTAAADLETLRGIEGYGSRLYFSVFGLLLRNEAIFTAVTVARPATRSMRCFPSFIPCLPTRCSTVSRVRGLIPIAAPCMK